MKKIAFIVILIAVIAGIVFGGIALASPAPAPKPAHTSGPVHMDTFSGNVTVSNELSPTPLSFVYPNARHVSITVGYSGLDEAGDTVRLGFLMLPMGGWAVWRDMAGPSTMTADWHTSEFDADNWSLEVSDMGGDPLQVYYRVTVTYPK